MKFWLLAATALTAIPALATAQTSVTLYGLADVGVNVVNRGAGQSNTLRIDSGMLSTSRWGVRGVEDLGGGLAAIFQLEGQINVDDGSGAATGGGFSFARRSYVGLQGGFGQLYMGRDYLPAYWADLMSDVTAYGLYGSSRVFQAAGGLTNRASNAIFWNSPNWGGLTLKAAYSAGEFDTDPKSRGNAAALAAFYANGPIALNVYYQTVNNVATPVVKTKEYGIGGGYDFGSLRIRAGYGRADPDGASNNLSQFHLGAAYIIGPGEAYIQATQMKREAASGTTPKSTTIGTGYLYNLSKRTTLYASFGVTRNNETGNFSLVNSANAFAPSAVGENPKALALGVRHAF